MIVTSDPAVLMLDIEHWTAAQVRGVAEKLAHSVYDKTPKDTGYARSNWVVSIGQPIETVVGSKESIDDSRFNSSVFALQQFGLLFTNVIYICNNVPYIGKLNDGWSSQAPAGFIEAALADAQTAAEWPYAG